MNPKDIMVIRGDELEMLLSELRDSKRPVYKLSVCIDGGAKVKINESTWSPPLGRSLAEEEGA